MTGITRRNLKIAAASLLAIFLVAYLLLRPGSGTAGGGENAPPLSAHAGSGEGPLSPEDDNHRSDRKDRSKGPSVDIVPADAPSLVEAIEKIKQLESKRVEFDREILKDKETTHELYLKAPSPAEAQEINRIISEVHGFAKDDGRGVRSWQEELRKEYVMPAGLEGSVITVRFNTDSPAVRYEMNGIPVGKYARRENGSVVSSDLALYGGYSASLPVSRDSNWRFSYLYEKDNTNK